MQKSLPEVTQSFLKERDIRVVGFISGFVGGSRTIVNPPPLDTDMDLVLHVDNVADAAIDLETQDWDSALGDYVDESMNFTTLRKGIYNIMLVGDAYEYGALVGTTSLAREMNVKSKEERYRMFEAARLPWR